MKSFWLTDKKFFRLKDGRCIISFPHTFDYTTVHLKDVILLYLLHDENAQLWDSLHDDEESEIRLIKMDIKETCVEVCLEVQSSHIDKIMLTGLFIESGEGSVTFLRDIILYGQDTVGEFGGTFKLYVGPPKERDEDFWKRVQFDWERDDRPCELDNRTVRLHVSRCAEERGYMAQCSSDDVDGQLAVGYNYSFKWGIKVEFMEPDSEGATMESFEENERKQTVYARFDENGHKHEPALYFSVDRDPKRNAVKLAFRVTVKNSPPFMMNIYYVLETAPEESETAQISVTEQATKQVSEQAT